VHRGDGPSTGLDDGIYLGQGSRQREEPLRPTSDQLRNDVLPALHRAIQSTENRDIATACMVAMAKIGEDHTDFRLVDVFKQRLSRRDQEVRETAALAIGIAARNQHGELALLASLARDDAEGRKAYGGEVDVRTRSFALYGIGLLAHETGHLAAKREALTALQAVLADDAASNRNLKVASITAIGLLDIGSAEGADRDLRDEAVRSLEIYYDRQLGAGEQLIQAHCPTAIARLVGHSGPANARCKQRCADELRRDDRQRRSADLHRSCAQALGQLCEPYDDDRSQDAALSKLLWQVRSDHQDAQTRSFATIALGQIGGAKNRELLVRAFSKAKALDKPWCAIALGVMAHAGYVARERAGLDFVEARDIGEALELGFTDGADPSLTGAIAIALGLCRHRDVAPKMRQLVIDEKHKEAQAGYLALGLALMNDRDAVDTLQRVIPLATRRPDLLKQAAVALGLLGDKSAATTLRAMLGDADTNLATLAAVSSALGLIGDRRSLQPLEELLADASHRNLSRAFAAVALGGIADRAPLPWYAKIAANVNYRASTETLTNQASGVLDIL
jgi:hypothetical protein